MRMNINLINEYKKEAEMAKREWEEAMRRYDYVDADLIKSAIYEIKSKELRYMAFVNRLKNEVMR